MFISYICLYFIVHSSPYLCVCGDDDLGADDLTSEPRDA